MKIILGALGAVAACLTAAVIILGLNTSGLHAQVRADQAAMATISRQVGAITSKASGQHRDLITCHDWSEMNSTVSGTDSAGGQITAYTESPTLPAHCVNG